MWCTRFPIGVGRRGNDDGVTLAELLVAMSITTIAAAIGTSAIVQIYRAVDSFQAQSTAEQQLTTTFERLDKQVRYATAISQPGMANADYYVEYLIGSSGTPTCTELKLDPPSGKLQWRTWPNGSVTAMGAWLPLASGVSVITTSNGQVVQPFTLTPATSVLNYERLQVSLNSSDGTGSTAANRQSIVTWAAMNADRSAATDVCTEGRAVA
jgi:prepilin-type N-terminal cleavage/methylation domain-containing protein